MFDGLGEAFAKFAVRQRPQRFRVDEHQARLMEGTQEIFPLADVDPGLAADRGIDLRDDGRRHLYEGDTAVENGGDEARQIPDHAATQRDDQRLPVMSGADHFPAECFRLDHRFRRLASGDRVQGRVETGSFQGFHQGTGVKSSHRVVADNRRAQAGDPGLIERFSGLAEQAGFDEDRVGAVSEIDVDGRHGGIMKQAPCMSS